MGTAAHADGVIRLAQIWIESQTGKSASRIDLVQIDSVSGEALPLKPLAALLCRMGGCGRQGKEREKDGQGVSRVGMTTDLHLYSVAVGKKRSRCEST